MSQVIEFLQLLEKYNFEQIKVPKYDLSNINKTVDKRAKQYWAQHEPIFAAFAALISEHKPDVWLNLFAIAEDADEVVLFKQRFPAVNRALRSLPYRIKIKKEKANVGSGDSEKADRLAKGKRVVRPRDGRDDAEQPYAGTR